jgi:tRNA-2-methylthio-N6-dimethylallyladenosine synthase
MSAQDTSEQHAPTQATPTTLEPMTRAASPKRVFVKTFGCQMNVYDSDRMTEQLAREGYGETADMAAADMIILNTCHIREKAVEKVYSDLGRIRDIKTARARDGRETLIAVTGCVAQAEGREIARRQPAVDLVVGPQSYQKLPAMIAEHHRTGRAIVETTFPEHAKFDDLPPRVIDGPAPARKTSAAFLTVQEGCDKFCTFCVVPYTRGAEYSREVAAIEAEARTLVARGMVEITLLGQNVNAYHGQGGNGATVDLAGLIRRLARIDGLQRLRYTTSHPRDMTDALIQVHADEPKLMPYLHLPFQSGSDRILAAMNRRHTVADYAALVARIRAANPAIALSTDIIVGFPGETDDEFQATMTLVREIGFAAAYTFKYSARPGTPAATMDGDMSDALKNERLLLLQALLSEQSRAFNAGCVGQTMDVLFERPGRRVGQWIGRSPYLQSVYVEADASLIGQMRAVEIIEAGPNSLAGHLCAV